VKFLDHTKHEYVTIIEAFHRKEKNYLTFYNDAAAKVYTLLYLAATMQTFILAFDDRQCVETAVEAFFEFWRVARSFVDIV
jgi:hypothetical protein